MKRTLYAALILAVVAVSAFAAQQSLFDRYESVRQALLKNDVAAVQTAARDLGTAARAAKIDAVAAHAGQLAAAKTIKDARNGFAVVSQDMIAYRKGLSGATPVVLYCSMEKKSWLQPSASPVANPYLDESMRACGQVVK